MTVPLYCGIDLHSNNSVISIQDKCGNLVYEKRLPNDLNVILPAMAPYREYLQGSVVESTYNWYWLVDGLMEAGYQVQLANPGAIVQYAGIKHTNDFTDARFLAHLLSLGVLPTGYIYPKETRGIRDLLRRRLLLVSQRSSHRASLQSLLARHTGKRLSERQIRKLDSSSLQDLLSIPCSNLMAEASLSMINALSDTIEQLEKEVSAHCINRTDYQLLTSINGVGELLGATVALETGSIARFPDAGHYASYSRCVAAEKISNGKSKGRNNCKNGNRYLGLAFTQAAHMAIIWEPKIKRFYQKKSAKSHLMVAKKAVAGKLARAVYYMLKNEERFDVNRAFG
jgi:transposase